MTHLGNVESLEITAEKFSTEDSMWSFHQEFSYLIVGEDILDLSKLDMDDEETWLFNPLTGTRHYNSGYGDRRRLVQIIQSWLEQSDGLELSEQSIQSWLERPDDQYSEINLSVSSGSSSCVASLNDFDDDDDFRVETKPQQYLATNQQRPLGKLNCDVDTKVIPYAQNKPTSPDTSNRSIDVQEHEREEYSIYFNNYKAEWFKNRQMDPERNKNRQIRKDLYALFCDRYQPPGLLSAADSDELFNPSRSECRKLRADFLNRPNRFDPPLDQTESQDVCPIYQTKIQDACPLDQTKLHDVCALYQTKLKDVCPLDQIKLQDACPLDQSKLHNVWPLDQTKLHDACPLDQSQSQCKCNVSSDQNPLLPTTNCRTLDSNFTTQSEKNHPLVTSPSLASLRERFEKIRSKQYSTVLQSHASTDS